MARCIAAACDALAADPSVRVTVLTSSHDRAFCVGADLKERNSFTDDELRRQRPTARACYTGVLELPMPAIAAVHGFALGGGFELALACDLIVADATAVVGLPEVSVGVIPGGGGTQLLPRRAGRPAPPSWSSRPAGCPRPRRPDSGWWTSWWRRTPGAPPWSWPGGSPPARRSDCAPPRRRCGSAHGLDLRAGLEVEDAAWRTVAFSGDRLEGVAAFNEKRSPEWPGV